MKASRFNFRAWCKYRKMMALNVQNEYDTVGGVRFTDGTEPGECSFSSYITDDYILMQSTGLVDKNGKEIFEGDVVDDHVGRGEVVWSCRYTGFRVSYGNGRAKWFSDYLDKERSTIAVVGNIYENPELMEATNER